MQKLQLSIPQSCHEAWDAMTPTAKGKFCASCAKEVIDFSAMTDAQLMRYFASLQTANICGRVHSDQLNREFSTSPPPKKMSWYWQLAISLGLLLGKSQGSYAQGMVKNKATVSPVSAAVDKELEIMPGGKNEVEKSLAKMISVLDEEGKPVANASIYFARKHITIAADSLGRFNAAGHKKENIKITAAGYMPRTIQLATDLKQVVMQAEYKMLDDVRVVASGLIRCSHVTTCITHTMGGMIASVRVQKTWRDSIISVLPFVKPAITLFPNPVQKSGTVNVQLPEKKAGPFVLQLLDAAGKVLLQQNVADKILVVPVNIPSTWAGGFYFVRLMNGQGKLVGTGKLQVR